MYGDISLEFWSECLWWLVMLSIFSCNIWSFVCCLWKVSIQVLGPFLNCIICLLGIELYEFFIYFRYWPLIGCLVLKYFLSFHMLPFQFIDCFLCSVEAFQLNIVPLVNFCCCCLCYCCLIQKTVTKTNVKNLFLYVFL